MYDMAHNGKVPVFVMEVRDCDESVQILLCCAMLLLF